MVCLTGKQSSPRWLSSYVPPQAAITLSNAEKSMCNVCEIQPNQAIKKIHHKIAQREKDGDSLVEDFVVSNGEACHSHYDRRQVVHIVDQNPIMKFQTSGFSVGVQGDPQGKEKPKRQIFVRKVDVVDLRRHHQANELLYICVLYLRCSALTFSPFDIRLLLV